MLIEIIKALQEQDQHIKNGETCYISMIKPQYSHDTLVKNNKPTGGRIYSNSYWHFEKDNLFTWIESDVGTRNLPALYESHPHFIWGYLEIGNTSTELLSCISRHPRINTKKVKNRGIFNYIVGVMYDNTQFSNLFRNNLDVSTAIKVSQFLPKTPIFNISVITHNSELVIPNKKLSIQERLALKIANRSN
jgi:hypothetical protein